MEDDSAYSTDLSTALEMTEYDWVKSGAGTSIYRQYLFTKLIDT